MNERKTHPREHEELETTSHEVAAQRSQEELDELLDEALAGTFPASDPIELSVTTD
ncbi:MAG TPA: hypothetical protein VF210_12035 [Pseudomonadales bacterium]